ncbi:flagellar assembly protein FliH [Cohnella cholangitidis]|uniref:Flagellar assembly protein FliH n=1 Tax=Cohnella cholangitidis TaxID=2598458 RepID=A0A7G5BT88_9BACL|nr:flagellar assembly protein FliH [Cohnella cholangitidis]QMV40172.1 flagellar assembly protein FliH [Cohnella cholangitidis]
MSNLIKSSHVVSLDDLKRLELIRRITPSPQNISESGVDGEGNETIDVETQSLKDRILADAEEAAQQILQQARADAAEIRDKAGKEIEDWWQSRREEDSQVREEASRQGYDEGYEAGSRQAEEVLHQNWASRLQEAQTIVEQAYAAKETVITEGESFLVELSCSIAEKIISRKLSKAPEMSMKLFEKALARRREQGVIVLCVAPSQFAYVQAAKDELAMILDAQAELQIVPDSSIKEGGCIVRSAFGSIDARVDTQLEAIREQLLKVASHRIEEGDNIAAP